MEQNRKTYKIAMITVNGVRVNQVIIDQHYNEKHRDHMSDQLILKLVKELDGRRELPDEKTGTYSYYATLIVFDEKPYRLIWLLEDHAIYIGVVNAYRSKKRS